jgi:antitoxin component HigA of HigAB toxin-antitoxin module
LPSNVAEVRAAVAKVGGLVKNDAEAEEIEEARRDLKAIKAAEYIRNVVESAPPLNPEQFEVLRALLPVGRAAA